MKNAPKDPSNFIMKFVGRPPAHSPKEIPPRTKLKRKQFEKEKNATNRPGPGDFIFREVGVATAKQITLEQTRSVY
jgi:hypothetical protein